MCTRNVLLQRLVNGAHYACESRAGFSPAGGWTRQTPRSGLVCRKKLTSLVRHGSLEWQAAPTPRARSLGPEVLYGRTEFQYRQAWKPGSVDGIWTWFPSGIQTWVFRLLTFQLGICWRGARPQGFFCSLSLSYIRLTLYLKMHGYTNTARLFVSILKLRNINTISAKPKPSKWAPAPCRGPATRQLTGTVRGGDPGVGVLSSRAPGVSALGLPCAESPMGVGSLSPSGRGGAVNQCVLLSC